jgi:hypothetical protein
MAIGLTQLQVTISNGTSLSSAVDPAIWRGVNQIKVRSDTLASPVNQTADRALTLMTHRF